MQGHPKDKDLITQIALAMTDHPSEERLYSSKGCKTAASGVTLSIWALQGQMTRLLVTRPQQMGEPVTHFPLPAAQSTHSSLKRFRLSHTRDLL